MPRPMMALLCITLAGAALPGAMQPAQADAAATARQAIETAYHQADAAGARKDLKGMLAYNAPDFQAISPEGKAISGAEQRQTLAALVRTARSIAATTTVEKFSLAGSQASVVARRHQSFVLTQAGPTGPQEQRLVVDTVNQDLWRKTAHGWQRARSQARSFQSTVNGQPVSRPAK